MKKTGLLADKVGIECDKHGCHIGRMLEENFKAVNAETFNATDFIESIRKMKSKDELDYIVQSTHIVDVGMKAVKEYLKPGISENELFAYARYKMGCAGGEPEGVSFIHGGQRALRGHDFPSHEKLEKGDVVIVDLFGSYQRYSADLSRIFSIGTPDYNRYGEEMLEFFKIAQKYHPLIRERIASTLKPNMKINNFMRELKEYYQQVGIWGKQFWLGGYDMGILWPGDCSGGTMVYDSDMDKGEQCFTPGTAVNFETGFWVIDTLVFYEDKAIIAGQTPWDIVVV